MEVILRTFLLVLVLALVGGIASLFLEKVPLAEAGQEPECARLLVTGGGEVVQDLNGDGVLDPIAEAVRLLSWAFLGARAPVAPCAGATPAIPDTGQLGCFEPDGEPVRCFETPCYLQDGAYATGCPIDGRFVDNGDGTVTDKCTGLMWQKSTGTQENSLSWCEAVNYCENLVFAGHDDWRLPNVRELLSIVDHGRLQPSMDPVFNGGFGLNFHSSTTYSAAPAYAYFVSFFDGSVHHAPKPERGPVLPVRGGLECVPLLVTAHGEVIQDMNGDGVLDPIAEAVRLLSWAFLGARPPPVPCDPDGESVGLPDTGQTTCYDESGAKIPCDSATCPGQDGTYATGCPIDGRFVDNGDDTVTDNCAGLMWEKPRVIDASFLHWCNALQYCEDLFLAGHDDWRLPNVRELESLIDYGRLGPSIDPVFGEVSGGFWSSTSSVVEPRSARYVHLLKGEVLTLSKGDVAQALAVRTQP